MHSILNNHNRRLLDGLNWNSAGSDRVPCICRKKEECSLGGRCNSLNVEYQACISPCNIMIMGGRVYIGIFVNNWKQSLCNHWRSFSNPRLRNQIAPSKYFWNLKDQGLSPQIKWKIIRQSSVANIFNSWCNLCNKEKISIITFKDLKRLLNARNELAFKCKHKDINYLDWGPLRVQLKNKNRYIDFRRTSLKKITFISVMNSIILYKETWVQSQVESYQRVKKWYLMPPCITLSIIRYGSGVKWSNTRKGITPSPTPTCSSYRKVRLRITLD